jgi:hypothetical protein
MASTSSSGVKRSGFGNIREMFATAAANPKKKRLVQEYQENMVDEHDDDESNDKEDVSSDSELSDSDHIDNEVPVVPCTQPACTYGPSDISKFPIDGPQQIKKTFPKTAHGQNTKGERKLRSFNAEWYTSYPWLEYSQETDSAYCFSCRHFCLPTTLGLGDKGFIENGFKNWKKATYKDAGFSKHNKSKEHRDAMVSWMSYKTMLANNTSVHGLLDEGYRQQIEDNRYYIKCIADVLLLTARQNFAQRGHREGSMSDNQGGFLAILNLLASRDEKLKKFLDATSNHSKYLSPKIQNEILNCMATMVRDHIISEVKQSVEFAILVDETKDVSKIEQISFVIRYYFNGEPKEAFLTFRAAEGLDAESLFGYIVATLELFGLDVENVVAQGYDGAAVMSGVHKGVAARLRQRVPRAVNIHCHNHRLNLVLVDTMKAIPAASEFLALLESLYVFVSGSYVHSKWIDLQKSMFPTEKPRELKRLSETRWACRIEACRAVRDRFSTLFRLLREITEEPNADRAIRAKGLLLQLNAEFVLMLHASCEIFGQVKAVSDFLQCPKADYSYAIYLIATLRSGLVELRNDPQKWVSLWETTKKFCNQANIEFDVEVRKKPQRSRKLPSHLESSIITEPIGAGRDETYKKENFRTHILIPLLDVIVAELDNRFTDEVGKLYNGISALSPASEKFLDWTSLKPFAEHYVNEKDTMEDLKHEMHGLKRLLERRKAQGHDIPKSLSLLSKFLLPLTEAYFVLARLVKIAIILPVSTAGCERSFSALKLIKTYIRNSMTNERIADVAVLYIARTIEVDMDAFVLKFADNHKNRRLKLK